MPASRLDDTQVRAALAALPGWSGDAVKLQRTYRFGDFLEAMSFMSAAVSAIHALDHHPEWFNVYKTVEVTLSTHDAGGVTELDIKLAEAMDKIAA